MSFSTEKLKYLSIVSKKVDNPGAGNCAFYSFAIGLIEIIQNEHVTKHKQIFTRWMLLDEQIESCYDKIIKFDMDNQDRYLLDTLQKSLRNIAYNFQLDHLKRDCAQSITSAFAIVLISIFRAEQEANNKQTFDYLISLAPELEQYYEQLCQYDHNNKDHSPAILHILEDVLKRVSTDPKLNEIKRAHAESIKKHRFSALEANLVYLKFGELYHVNQLQFAKADKDANDLNRSAALMAKIAELKKKQLVEPTAAFSVQIAAEQAALRDLFLELLYGPQVDVVTITEDTELNPKSPILEGLGKLKANYYWGNQEHLELLTRAFELNLHALVNGEAMQEFVDIPSRTVITVNNHGYVHWTTRINVVVPISQEKEALTLPPSELPHHFGHGRNKFLMYKPEPRPALAAAPKVLVHVTKDADPKKVEHIKKVREAIRDFRYNLLDIHKNARKHNTNNSKVKYSTSLFEKNRYSKAYEAGEKIKNRLELLCYQYEHNGIPFHTFQNSVYVLLTYGRLVEGEGDKNYYSDLKTLKLHRGYGEWVANILIVLCTGGLAHLCYAMVQNKFEFFHIPTKSESLMRSIHNISKNLHPLKEEIKPEEDTKDNVLQDGPITFEPKNNPFNFSLNPFK